MISNNHKAHYDQLVKHIPVGVYRFRTTLQEQMTFEYVNHQFCELLGVSARDVYRDSKFAFSTIHPVEFEKFMALNREVIQTQQPFMWEGRVIVSGEIKWLRIASSPEPLENGATVWSGAVMDITDRKNAEKALQEINAVLEKRLAEIEKLQKLLHDQAVRDYLTGLFNRRYLDETIEREVARAQREKGQLSVVMMDIDHFKGINDTYGHQAGDMVLIELGHLISKFSRTSDIACRYGGDEFVVVMPNASPDQALKRADQWRVAFSKERFTYNERRFATTLSMGIAAFPEHASSSNGVFQAADQALYKSKMNNNLVTISRRVSTSRLSSIGGGGSQP